LSAFEIPTLGADRNGTISVNDTGRLPESGKRTVRADGDTIGGISVSDAEAGTSSVDKFPKYANLDTRNVAPEACGQEHQEGGLSMLTIFFRDCKLVINLLEEICWTLYFGSGVLPRHTH
jgi:hypothetical protein